jgi:hypothetical protein
MTQNNKTASFKHTAPGGLASPKFRSFWISGVWCRNHKNERDRTCFRILSGNEQPLDRFVQSNCNAARGEDGTVDHGQVAPKQFDLGFGGCGQTYRVAKWRQPQGVLLMQCSK